MMYSNIYSSSSNFIFSVLAMFLGRSLPSASLQNVCNFPPLSPALPPWRVTFELISVSSFKSFSLLCHKLKTLFCCRSYEIIFLPKTVKIKNPKKHMLVGNMKFYYRAKSQPKQIKIEKLVWDRPLFDDSWPGVCTTTKHIWKLLQKRTGNKLFRIVHPLIVMIMIVASRERNKFHTLQYTTLLKTLNNKG